MANITDIQGIKDEANNCVNRLYDDIEDVIERAEKVFRALDWKWRGEVPNKEQIRQTVFSLLESMKYEVIAKINSVFDLKEKICATGGFEIYVMFDLDEVKIIPHAKIQLVAIKKFGY
ncbi:MAG: hypothetical protein ACOC80_14255 [Petrotogales bacterium]